MKARGREVGVVAGRWRERRLDGGDTPQAGRGTAAKGELFAYIAVYGEPEDAHRDPTPSRQEREILGPSSEALAGELRRRLADAYYQDPARSVTASLGHALQSVNSVLHSANEIHPPGVRRYAAASCLVVRDDEAFVALVGPAVVHLAEGTSVETMTPPEDSPSRALLGSATSAGAELTHRTFAGPTSILLGATALSDALPDSEAARLLSDRPGWSATVALRTALEGPRHSADLAATLVEVDGDAFGVGAHDVAADLAPRTARDGRPSQRPPTSETPGDAVTEELDALPPTARTTRRARRPRARAGAPRVLLYALLAIVVLALAYAFPVRLFLDFQAGQAKQALVRQAEEKERDSRAATDPASRLKLLVEASSLAQQAAQSGRADASVAELARRLQTELDTLTSAVRLDEPARLTSLDGQPGQLVLGASDLFVLDRGSERVFRFPLEPNRLGVQSTASPVIFRKGDKLGELPLDTPRQMLWMPGGSGRNEGFLVVDSSGTLFEWDPERPGLKIARQPSPDGSVPTIAGYAGTLYTLDAAGDRLEWRPPSSGVYDAVAYPYFQPDVNASVSDVVSFAVAEDLYLLRKSGQIDRFVLGKPSTFANVPPDRPLGAGAALVATARGVYAFDPSNRRIVQFARDGTYRRQFVLEGMEELRDVALDESRGLIYTLGPQGLYLYRSSDLAAFQPTPTPALSPTVTPAATPGRTPTARPSTPAAAVPTARRSTPPPATPTARR